MATKKTKKTSSTETVSSNTASPMDYFKFGESYTSLILGIVVVIIASILLISFVRNRDGIDLPSGDSPDISSTKIGPDEEGAQPGEYIVKAGDDLWSISEDQYGSGYNWVDIQKANNITDPNDITEGSKLVIPDVKLETVSEASEKEVTPTPTVVDTKTEMQPGNESAAISGNTYTVAAGDTLWKISERKYNDGYQFVKIAQANNIVNPDYILVGQVITFP